MKITILPISGIMIIRISNFSKNEQNGSTNLKNCDKNHDSTNLENCNNEHNDSPNLIDEWY